MNDKNKIKLLKFILYVFDTNSSDIWQIYNRIVFVLRENNNKIRPFKTPKVI